MEFGQALRSVKTAIALLAINLLLNLFIHLSLNQYLLGGLIRFAWLGQATALQGFLIVISLLILKFSWSTFKISNLKNTSEARTLVALFALTIIAILYNCVLFVEVAILELSAAHGIVE